MDFSQIDLDDDLRAFWTDVRSFMEHHVTESVLLEERRTGSGFCEDLHLAMGNRGWVAPDWPAAEGGAGLDAVRTHILRHELRRSGAPSILAGTTLLPPVSIRMFGTTALQREILPGVAKGIIRICLGYTEPDTGSDLAGVRTRATRDGDDWIVNGQKMFTTGAQHCQFCFLLARSDPTASKHRGLTVLLVPLDLPGIEIRPIGTLGGERTNFVFYDDVRVPDRYRIGEEGAGWMVISGALGAEHHLSDDTNRIPLNSGGGSYTPVLARALDAAVSWAEAPGPNGRRPIDDPTVRERLARVCAHIEACEVATGPHGRVLSSQLLIEDAADLLDLVGPAALLSNGQEGSVAGGYLEYAHRFAQGTAIYGGTVEIHRSMIAERFLGLPRSTPKG